MQAGAGMQARSPENISRLALDSRGTPGVPTPAAAASAGSGGASGGWASPQLSPSGRCIAGRAPFAAPLPIDNVRFDAFAVPKRGPYAT